MKKLLKNILLVAAIICVVYFFAVDIAIKYLIQREGSQALRAQLDIASVSFHLLPSSLTLRGVQATNPQQPSNNLFQADVIALPLSLGELLDRKLIVERMQIHGLRFAQPRAHSGAIDGLTSPALDTQTPDSAPNAQQLQQQKVAQQRDDLTRKQQDLAVLRNDWQQKLRALPSVQQMSDYQFRAQSRDANNRARLRNELNDELANVRKLQEQFALDFARVEPELNASALAAGSGVRLATGAPISISGGLLGQEFKPLLAHILGFVLALPNDSNDSPTPLQGWQLLARTVDIDGELDLGNSPLHFVGTLENLTPQPRLFNVVTRFDLHSPEQAPGKLSASGNLDYRKLPLQNVRFDLSAFPVQQLPLSTHAPLQITVVNALADVQGLLSLTGNQVDINMLARFKDATLQITAADDPVSRSAATALRSARDFDLNLQASGNVNNPQLKLNSSLDALLSNAINRELSNNSAAGVDTMSQPAAPEAAALRPLIAELQQIQAMLLTTQHTLQSLIDN